MASAKDKNEDAEEVQATQDEIKPELARNQVWQGTGGNRLIVSIEDSPEKEGERVVKYQTEASDGEAPKEDEATYDAFQKWAKKMLGTVG